MSYSKFKYFRVGSVCARKIISALTLNKGKFIPRWLSISWYAFYVDKHFLNGALTNRVRKTFICTFGGLMSLFLYIYIFLFQYIHSYNYSHTTVAETLLHIFIAAGSVDRLDTPWIRAEIRTRACLTASQRTTIWAALHPKAALHPWAALHLYLPHVLLLQHILRNIFVV